MGAKLVVTRLKGDDGYPDVEISGVAGGVKRNWPAFRCFEFLDANFGELLETGWRGRIGTTYLAVEQIDNEATIWRQVFNRDVAADG